MMRCYNKKSLLRQGICLLITVFLLAELWPAACSGENWRWGTPTGSTYKLTYQEVIELYIDHIRNAPTYPKHDIINIGIIMDVGDPDIGWYNNREQSIDYYLQNSGFIIADITGDNVEDLLICKNKMISQILTMENGRVKDLMEAIDNGSCYLLNDGSLYRVSRYGGPMRSYVIYSIHGKALPEPVQGRVINGLEIINNANYDKWYIGTSVTTVTEANRTTEEEAELWIRQTESKIAKLKYITFRDYLDGKRGKGSISGMNADPYVVSYTTYDTTYPDILNMYIRVLNGTDRKRHDLFNTLLYDEFDPKRRKKDRAFIKEEVGYTVRDLNGDGLNEMILGAVTADPKTGATEVYEVFGMADGKVKEIFKSGAASTAYLTEDNALLVGAGEEKAYTVDRGGELREAEKADRKKALLPLTSLRVYELSESGTVKGTFLSIGGRTTGKGTVNIRREAGRKAKILLKGKAGTAVEILGEEGDFYRIRIGGKEGFVLKEYVLFVEAGPTGL